MMKPYVVSIATMGRLQPLLRTLAAIGKLQTYRPELIIIGDNNPSPSTSWEPVQENRKLIQKASSPTPVQFIRWDTSSLDNTDAKSIDPSLLKTDSYATHRALEFVGNTGNEPLWPIMVKWDDDLIPDKDCIPLLVERVSNGATAAGGMYPGHIREGYCEINEGKLQVPDDDLRHLQFYDWKGPHRVINTSHLYSSFAFDVKKGLTVGGYPIGYHLHKHETEFTIRLWRTYSRVSIVTAARAKHLWAEGGLRSHEDSVAQEWVKQDITLFKRNISALDMDPMTWLVPQRIYERTE